MRAVAESDTKEPQMSQAQVRFATPSDEAAVVQTIVSAFAADPMARWSWPDDDDYQAHMPSFTRAFGGRAFECQGAHCTDDCSGAALWLAPELHPDEDALGAIVESTVSDSIRGELYAVLEQMETYHPTEPHWYLPMIGVGASFQGKGFGGALLSFALERFDEEGRVAYLESSNPRNISLYERHGFDALGEIQVGTSPTIVPMVRRPK